MLSVTDEDLAFYPLIEAARELNTTPWELMKQPPIWIDWARVSLHAKAIAEKDAQQESKRNQPINN